MGNETKKISRKELYNRVWKTSMTKLSAEYGISDNGLRKICKKHNIPLPGIGYWAKKAAGYRMKNVPLPDPSKETVIEIRPNPSNHVGSASDPILSEYAELVQKSPPIVIAKSLRSPHPLVRQASLALELCRPNDVGILEPADKDCLNIRVSEKSLRRALRIMDALIKGLQERSFDVFQDDESTKVKIQGEVLGFGIREELVSRKIESDSTNLDGYYQFGHSRFDHVRVPSGKLCLTIDAMGYFGNENCRRNWRDTKRRQLEDSLDAFVIGLLKIAVQKKEYRRQEEEKERRRKEIAQQREERRQQLAELKRKVRQEQARVDELITHAENHFKSKQIRDFIEAVEVERQKEKSVYIPDDDFNEWVKWAQDQADRLDPLAVSPPSILNEVVEDDDEDRSTW